MKKFWLIWAVAAMMVIVDCNKDIEENKPPVINNLSADHLSVFVGEKVTLTCDASDPEAGELTYTWQVDAGSLADENANPAVWTAPGSEGSYSIICEVSDPEDSTASDTIQITVMKAQEEPLIDSLYADQTTVRAGGEVIITCAARDLQDETLAYHWSASSGSFTNPDTNPVLWHASFDAGTYYVVCEVTDSDDNTVSDSIAIEVLTNTPPRIDSISGDTLGTVGHTMEFTCHASDPEGDEPLFYAWEAPDGGSIEGAADASTVSWKAPDSIGTYRLVCTVSDGILESQDTVSVTLQNYFPLGLGYQWHYEGFLFAQTVNMDARIVLATEQAEGKVRYDLERVIYLSEVLYDQDTVFAYIVTGDSVFFDDPKAIVDYLGLLLPLWEAKTWNTKGNGTATIAEMTSCTVPLGTFSDCVRLEISGGQVNRTMWLAPEIGTIVTYYTIDQQSIELKLTSYDFGTK